MDTISQIESSPNPQGVSDWKICFLCNGKFPQNFEFGTGSDLNLKCQKEEDILHLFFEQFGSFEKSLFQFCHPCKSMCKTLLEARDTLSNLIKEIRSLLHRNKNISGYLLSKSQVLTQLFQSESVPSSIYISSISQHEVTNASSISATNDSKFTEQAPCTSKNIIVGSFNLDTDNELCSVKNSLPGSTGPIESSSDIEKRVESSDENSDQDDESKDNGRDSISEEPVHVMVGKHLCHICDKPFKHLRDMENHIGYHRQEKPFICEICGVGYRQKRGLESHVAIHRGEALFKCDHCNKSFTQKSGLQRHLPIHSGETVFQCDLCGKGFMHHTSFAHHKRIHAGERKYNCESCNQFFISSSHLKRHSKIHTDEKSFKCEICQKSFISNTNLKSHLRVHTGIPAHSCPHCNQGFDKKHKMKRHLADVHPESVFDLNS